VDLPDRRTDFPDQLRELLNLEELWVMGGVKSMTS
jgi:hypothetical protein